MGSQTAQQRLLSGTLEARGTHATMSWSILPDDMEDHILGRLSLAEAARTSTTCRSFHRCSLRLLASQQNARCDLAVKWFGRGRITGLADIIDGYLNGEGMVTKLAKDKGHCCRISPDGLLQVESPAPRHMANEQALEAGAVDVSLISTSGWFHPPLCVYVYAPNQIWVRLRAFRGSRTFLGLWPKVEITVVGNKDHWGLEGVALVQALLSWGFGPQHDAWQRAEVSIHAWLKPGLPRDPARLQAQIAPLRALVAKHKNWSILK